MTIEEEITLFVRRMTLLGVAVKVEADDGEHKYALENNTPMQAAEK